MKTKKFLATLLCLPLLAGCGNNVKSPKFADYGKEITYEKLVEGIGKLSDSVLGKSYSQKKLESLESKGQDVTFSSFEIVRGKKSIYKEENSTKETILGKYDASESTLKFVDNYEQTKTKKEVKASSKDVVKEKVTTQQQTAKVNGKFFVVDANVGKAQYEEVTSLEKESEGKEYLDGYTKTIIENGLKYTNYVFAMTLEFYPMMDNVNKAKFKFYQNDKILTVEFKDSVKNHEYKPADKVLYVESGEYLTKWQVDTTENNWSVKFYQDSTTKYEFKENFDDNAKGDVATEVSKTATEYSFAKKDVKVKALDLSKYTAIGF